MGFYLGIDLGTSYFKAGVFDRQGNLVGLGRSYVDKRIDDKTICELPLYVFWSTLRDCVRQAIKKADINSNEIVSLAYSSQANSFVLLGEKEEPLTPLILWPDKRAGQMPVSLRSLIENHNFQERTGLGILPGIKSMAAKIGWFQENQQKTWGKTRSIMSISDYLTFSLTGQKVSDFSTASMTGFFDVSKEKWWDKALETLKIDKSFLSSPKRTGSYVDTLTEKGAKQLGLELNTKLFLGGLDHHMVAIGADLPNSKNISESTGTVLACVNYQNKYNPQNGVNIAPGLKSDSYFQMAFNENGAMALEWYLKNYASEFSIHELLKMAGNIKPNSDGLIAMPCVNKREGLSGFQNIKKEHTHGHFVRAILESTSRSLNELIMSLDRDNESEAVVSSGGGAQSPLWIEIKANMINKPFISLDNSELACLGAASIAFKGISQYIGTKASFQKQVSNNKIIYPNPVNVKKYKLENKKMNELKKDVILKSAKKSLQIESKAIADIIDYLDEHSFVKAVETLSSCPKIITCASGSSGIAAKKFAHSLCCIERNAQYLSPAEAIHGGMGCLKKGDAVVMVSRGGKTAELLPIIDVCNKKEVILIGITENLDSPLAKRSQIVVPMKIERESDGLNVMATASFVVTIALFDAMLTALMEITDYTLEQFALIHPGGAVGNRLNK